MKFLLAFIAVIAAASSAAVRSPLGPAQRAELEEVINNPSIDPALKEMVQELLGVESSPIAVGPIIIDAPEGIAVGPAIVEQAPIVPTPVIVEESAPIVPSPVIVAEETAPSPAPASGALADRKIMIQSNTSLKFLNIDWNKLIMA